jgi:hypothetical protein
LSILYEGKNESFPIPYYIGIFEYLTVDIIHINKQSCRGYRYIALFVDKATSKAFVQLIKHKDDSLSIFKVMIEENGPYRNTKSVELGYLKDDYDTAIINERVSTYLFQKHIRLYSSFTL